MGYWWCRWPLQPVSTFSWLDTLTGATTPVVDSGPLAPNMKDVPLLANFQEHGSFTGQFQSLMGIALDSKGNIFGVDCELHTVRKYAPDGKLLLSFGGKGSDPKQFNEPRGISVDEEDFVYVVDTWNGRVQKFTSEGVFLTTFGAEQRLFGPRAIAVRNGLVYVVDSGGGRIVVYTTDGAFVRSFGKKGSHSGELSEPVGIAITPEGTIYVLDSGNDRIQKFSPDGTASAILRVPGWKTKTLKEAHLAFSLPLGLFVVDPSFGTVALFSPDHILMGRIGDELSVPTGVAVNGNTILVSERRSGLIRSFTF
jgi:tripartite motif-containing protein 71